MIPSFSNIITLKSVHNNNNNLKKKKPSAVLTVQPPADGMVRSAECGPRLLGDGGASALEK